MDSSAIAVIVGSTDEQTSTSSWSVCPLLFKLTSPLVVPCPINQQGCLLCNSPKGLTLAVTRVSYLSRCVHVIFLLIMSSLDTLNMSHSMYPWVPIWQQDI